MPSKPLSTHAEVAQLIRKELKRRGIKGKVHSSSFAGGNAVDIYLQDQPPRIVRELNEFCGQFQYGSFNSMNDLYEYTNRRSDIPQVKYLILYNLVSDEMLQATWEYCREFFGGLTDMPEKYEDARNYNVLGGEYASDLVRSFYSGDRGAFWDKSLR